MSFILPFGPDRADGETELPVNPLGESGTGRVGTPNPAGGLSVYGDDSGTNIQEDVNSPTLERAEQCTTQHVLKSTFTNCLNLVSVLGRGTFVKDSFDNIWRILSAKIQSARGGYGTLETVAESISFDTPPDEYQMIPVELGINIIKHPRYFFALYPTGSDYSTNVGTAPNIATVAQVKQALIRAIQTYQDSPFFPSANNVNGLIQNQIIDSFINNKVPVQVNNATLTVNTTANTACLLAQAAAAEIIQKLWNQEDNPYLVGFQVTWTQYYFAPVFENPGGYIENPVGIVPDYFLSPAQDGSNTIFDQMASLNPQCYSTDGTSTGTVNISWLRKADEVFYERTWFRVVRTWIGSPLGHWDAQLYTHNDRPVTAADYLPLV